jgi:methyl-accepting chemotaxis protein
MVTPTVSAAPAPPIAGSGGRTRLGIRTKILAMVLVSVVVAATVGVVAIILFGRLGDRVSAVNERGLKPVAQLAEVRRWVLQTRVDALADDTVDASSHAAYLSDVDKVNAALATYTSGNDYDATQVAAFQTAWQKYTTIVGGDLLALARKGDWTAYNQLRNSTIKPLAVQYNNALTALEQQQAATAQHEVAAARSAANTGRTAVVVLLLVGGVVAVALGLLLAGRIVRRVQQVSDVLGRLAEGDLTGSVPVTSGDELGAMATNLNTSLTALRQIVGSVGSHAVDLARSGDDLRQVSVRISGSVDAVTGQTTEVSRNADLVSQNVQTVSAGAEEMTASIQEISQNTVRAAEVARHAVELASSADATMAKLGESSTEIGKVINMITSIAEQTNLLALNATIEAARAGDAGKGFAVVAGEVKDLAQETARATQNISRLIDSIQTDSGAAVAAIQEITGVIDQINDFQTTIASAIEEQTATTNEMSRNVSQAAAGTGQIAGNITSVAAATQTTSAGMTEAGRSIDGVAQMAADLRDLVRRFRY